MKYDRGQFLLNLFLLLVALGLSVVVVVPILGVDIVLFSILLLGAIIVLVWGISPLTTDHQLDSQGITLRQGWYFKATIPLDLIEGVERVEKGPLRTGVFFKIIRSTLYVTTRRTDLIFLHLKREKRFSWALGKRTDKVIFDTKDNRRSIRLINDLRGLTPSSPDRSS